MPRSFRPISSRFWSKFLFFFPLDCTFHSLKGIARYEEHDTTEQPPDLGMLSVIFCYCAFLENGFIGGQGLNMRTHL